MFIFQMIRTKVITASGTWTDFTSTGSYKWLDLLYKYAIFQVERQNMSMLN